MLITKSYLTFGISFAIPAVAFSIVRAKRSYLSALARAPGGASILATVGYLILRWLGDRLCPVPSVCSQEVIMRPVRRKGVSKYSSARQFRSNVGRTQKINLAPPPMRGGIRL